jgi:hypothetical protein
MPVEQMQTISPAVPSQGPLVQPHTQLGLSRPEAADYIGVGVSLFDEMVKDDQHAAAIEMAISVALLPKGTAIILQTKRHHLGTDILVCEPSQTNYSILAQVHGEALHDVHGRLLRGHMERKQRGLLFWRVRARRGKGVHRRQG